jgi:hypothetical protein
MIQNPRAVQAYAYLFSSNGPSRLDEVALKAFQRSKRGAAPFMRDQRRELFLRTR